MPNSVHSISIPSSTQHLGKVRKFVERYAIEANFPDEIVNSLQLAADEACANIIEHAYSGGERRTDEPDLIDIDVIIKPDRFIIRIRDKGHAFETTQYNEPDIRRYARNRKSGGFGVHLMRRLMDQVEYRTRGNSNECCLIKYRTKTQTKAAKKVASVKRVKKKTASTKVGAGAVSKARKQKSASSNRSTKASPNQVAAKKAAAKKAASKKAASKKATAKKSAAKKAAAKKVASKKAAAKKATAKKATAKKATAKKTAAKWASSKKAATKKPPKQAAKRSGTKKQSAKKSVAKKAAASKSKSRK